MIEAPRLMVNDHGYYEVRWRDGETTKRQSLKTKLADVAQKGYAHFLLRTAPAARYSVAEAWALREAECLHQVADADRIRHCWKALLPHFAGKDIETLKPADFSSYVQRRVNAGCVGATARRELVELRATFNHLVKTKRMTADQLPAVELPPASAARPFFLTLEQMERVLHAALEKRIQPQVYTRLELFLYIGLETGQRRRAIEALTWPQVDFAVGAIHFAKDGERVTKKRKASVPISARLDAVLRTAYAERTSEWVLRMPGSIRTTFETLMDELDLSYVTPHVLRHTFISHLLMRNIPIFTVSKLVGVSVAQIERTYGHLTSGYLRDALAR